MNPIALQPDQGLQNPTDPSADAQHPPAGLLARTKHEAVIRGLPWITLVIALLLGLFNRDLTQARDTIPFLVSFVFFGMPHGAMDWVVNQRLRKDSGRRGGLAGFSWYLALMAIGGLLLLIAPVVAVVAFFVLTVIHWGLGDLHATCMVAPNRVDRFAAISGRGLLILGAAFAFDPAAAWGPFALLIGDAGASPASIQASGAIGSVAFGIGVLATAYWVLRRWMAKDRTGAVLDALESALVVGAIALTDPLFGIGMYFLGTHSFRHSLRLASTPAVMPENGQNGSLTRRLIIVHLLSLPLLVPTFIILLGWSRFQFGGLDVMDLTVTMLGFFLVTTLPHHLLGCRLPEPRSS